MPVRNRHWYDRNATEKYPLDETAAAADSAGGYLPPDVLADLNLRYPAEYGLYPFVAAVTVTPTLVTVAVQAADRLDPPFSVTPLAVLTVRQPAPEGRLLALTPLQPGVGGWAVLWGGVRDRTYSGRFAGPRQALLTRRAARPYRPLPVAGLCRVHAARPLGGVVRLSGDAPLEVVAEDRDLPGVGPRRVAVVRLVAQDATDGFVQPAGTAQAANVFRAFAGPCAGRPESQTCGDPQPIEFVNTVGPDCDGVLTVEFKGCLVPAKLGDHAVLLDAAMSLSRVCVPARIPAPDGRLPGEYDPYTFLPPPPSPPPPPPPSPPAESIDVVGDLPHTECFYGHAAVDFVVKAGAWRFAADDSPAAGDYCTGGSEAVAYEAADPSTRAVSVWEGFDPLTVYRRYVADVLMTPGPRSNAGLVLNYRPHATAAGRYVYYVVEADYTAQAFRVARFNGVSFQTVLQQSVPGLATGRWYRLRADVSPGPSGGTTRITAVLTGIDDPVTVTIGPLVVSNYYPSTGRSGLGTDRAVSRFSFFHVEDLP